MHVDPKRLIDRSIADLTQLSAIFAAEVGQGAPPRTPELMACEEAMATITNLIPRLQVARRAPIAPLQMASCPNCED